MESKNLALKVLGAEALAISLLGTLVFFYARSVNDARARAAITQAAAQIPPPDVQSFTASYAQQAKSVKDLASAIEFRPEVDLIAFVVDTSNSMDDDRDELKDNVRRILDRYKGRSFQVVNFTGTFQVAGGPTRSAAELQNQIDSGQDLGGNENSFLALTAAADKAREKFKHPAIVLMTDAAPNDGRPGSTSNVTLDQAAGALNAADAELHVWAAFDRQEYDTGGAAATSPLYPDLVNKIRAGGKVYLVKRGNFDPRWLQQPVR
ncbi:MAG TPA: VWA domain-containing protein [Blastocatellia bacterium]|nr:VWA domain-containing protein [Blastocatellia bacterium]